MALADFLIHTVTIKRPVVTPDASAGETISSETTLYDTVPTCFQPVKAEQKLIYAQQNIKVEFASYFDRTISVREGDYLYYNSDRYVITGIRNLFDTYQQVSEVLCYRYGPKV